MKVQGGTYFTGQYTNHLQKASESSHSFASILSEQKDTVTKRPIDQLRDQYIPDIPVMSPNSTVDIAGQSIPVVDTARYRLGPPDTIRKSEDEYEFIGDFTILDKRTGNARAFNLEDLKIQVDENSGKKFLMSEPAVNTGMQVDDEMESFLTQVADELGVELQTVPAEDFSVYIGSIGIPYIMREDGNSFLPNYLDEDYDKLNAAMEKWMDIYPEPLLLWQAEYLAEKESMGELASLPDGGYITLTKNGVNLYDKDGQKLWHVQTDEEQYPEKDFRKYVLEHFADMSNWTDMEFWKSL